MDIGTRELDVLQEHLQNVSLEEKTQQQLDGTPMEVEQPNELADNKALTEVLVTNEPTLEIEQPKEALEEQNTPVLEVEKQKLEVEQPKEVLGEKDNSVPEVEIQAPKLDAEKEEYIQSKLNPTTDQGKKHLELKLKVAFKEREAGLTPELKLANLKKEWEAEYDEAKALQAQADFLMQEAVAQNFKPEKEKPWIWESEDSQTRIDREKSKNSARLKHYVETNKDDILLKALKQEIRLEMKNKPEAIQALDNEAKAQAFVQPIANKRISDTTQELEKLGKDKAYNRYYAKPPVQPKKDITTDFPGLDAAVGLHFRYPLLQKELDKKAKPKAVSPSEKEQYRKLIEQNQLRSDQASEVNKNVTEGRVLADRAKRFKPVI